MTNEEQTTKVDYASNSKVKKAPAEKTEVPDEGAKVTRMEGVEVTQRKKSLGRKIAETFTGDDIQSVGQYLIFEVFIPAAKTTISDMVSQGIERALFGENARGRSSSSSSRRPSTGRVSYSSMYAGDREAPREMSRRARNNHEMSEIIFNSRGEAEEAIERLSDLIDMYKVATVANFYDLVGVSSSFTDHKWGWDNLREARVVRTRDGYLLDMPATRVIN